MRAIRSLLGLTVVSLGVVCLAPAASSAPAQALAVSIGHDMPSWSPDGRIAFVGFRNGRVGDIFTMRPDGRGERQLTSTPQHEDMPRWSPDGSKIAFVRHTGGALINFQIFVMNADGSGQTQVTQDSPPNFAPAWSPDGSKLVFVSQRDQSSQIYVMNADGTDQRRLTEPVRLPTGFNFVANDSPDWSPDGSKIAFASNRSELLAWRLYTMNPDGSDVQPLTKNPTPWHNERRPAWSRDGSKVAYVSGPGRDIPVTNAEIYVTDADGSNERRLTRSDEAESSPSWSADGNRVVYARSLGILRPEIYVATGAGAQVRKLTGGTMKFAGVSTFPPQPVAGRNFTVELAVTPLLTGVRKHADVACYAAVGTTLLDVVLGTVVKGKLRCTFVVLRRYKGRKLLYSAAVRFGHTTVSRAREVPIG
jgi:Tol biopolymer transport system component